MPFATQVIQLLLISEQRDKDIVSAHHVKQVSHEMCLDVLVDSVLAHLKNNETFILPSQGCFNGVPLFLAQKVQHCKSHGVLNKNADPECSGCISVRSCRSAAAANTLASPRMRSTWYRECGQDLWTMCKGVM